MYVVNALPAGGQIGSSLNESISDLAAPPKDINNYKCVNSKKNENLQNCKLNYIPKENHSNTFSQ